ncbi:MAG: SDR family oxidoreductase [Chloroflexi bacterium]|nr:SDR family oxidoreductase [Chloroflexota bacterium]MBI3169766.1 SDR family oxidoreductase [Chloroflexota bacterium]
MKLLFIGGTGLISSACSELAVERGHELFLLNRSASTKYPAPKGAIVLQGDVHTDSAHLSALLAGQRFDAVVDFIAFHPYDIQRDLSLFRDKTDQFVFISSASAYQKPVKNYLITEETPLENPFWEYSRNKIDSENVLMDEYRSNGFPVTIVRPSHTYGPSQIPFSYGSWLHPWTLIHRMKKNKPVIVPGDGTSLWVLTWNADFAKGLLGLLGNKKAIGEAFHITSDEVLSWEQIYFEAYQALGADPNVIHIPSDYIARFDHDAVGSLIGDKSNSVVFDNSKIKRFVPEYNCEVKWSEGLRRSLAWFEAHPEFQTVDYESIQKWDRIIEGYSRALA